MQCNLKGAFQSDDNQAHVNHMKNNEYATQNV